MNEKMLSKRIKSAMEIRRMSQADIARKSGLSTAAVAQITTGHTADPGFSAPPPHS